MNPGLANVRAIRPMRILLVTDDGHYAEALASAASLRGVDLALAAIGDDLDQTATLHDLYEALDLPLAGRWRARHPVAPWQMQVAPAMERIVKAEAAAMRVTLGALLADVRAPATSPLRAISDASGSE